MSEPADDRTPATHDMGGAPRFRCAPVERDEAPPDGFGRRVDALRQLQDVKPDVMLVDIEMPRMDGFDLARNIRADERWAALPIVMITSRSGDKHRQRAFEIGVQRYLGKPYQESDLLENILKLVKDKANG